MRIVHVAAGLLAVAAGAVALLAPKGDPLHRRTGRLFVWTMLVMSSTGALMAALQPVVEFENVVAGVVTFYLVLTALLTVRQPTMEFQRIDAAALLLGLAAGLTAIALGLAAAGGAGGREGSAGICFLFGFVALLATLGDVRWMRGRRLQGAGRIARHLWRMCFSLFIAVGSILLGPPRRLPEPLRDAAWRPIPVLLVLLAMAYWLARTWLRQRAARVRRA